MNRFLLLIVLFCGCESKGREDFNGNKIIVPKMEYIADTEYGYLYYIEHNGNQIYVTERPGSAIGISVVKK